MISLFFMLYFFATGTIANGNSQHLSQISVLQDSFSSKTAQENLIWSNIQNTRDNTATLLDIDNSNIAVAAIFEDNEKKVNEVYLNSIAKGIADYTADQLAILQFVAGQCPWDGGNAVFRARGMLALVQRVIISDESMCEAKSLPEEEYNKETTEEAQVEEEYISEAGILLYPNPANGVLNLEWDSPLETAHTIQIFDINGRLLQQKETAIGNSFLQLNTTNIPVGLYILRISDNAGNIITNKKIVIVR